MTIQEFIVFAEQGREIEFEFAELSLFFAPNYDPNHTYYLWDNGSRRILVEGSLQEILEYNICGLGCMNDCWDKVKVEYIL